LGKSPEDEIVGKSGKLMVGRKKSEGAAEG
jgi:hypothetical protein